MKSFDVAVPLSTVCALLLVMAVKHFVADFVLQTNWIARGKERPTDWAHPLGVHVAIHGVMTLMIALAYKPDAWWLALIDIAVHAVIDRCKSMIAQTCKWPVTEPRFWWLLGLDQCLHQITNIALVAALIIAP